jgi:2'-5' RNA ligase
MSIEFRIWQQANAHCSCNDLELYEELERAEINSFEIYKKFIGAFKEKKQAVVLLDMAAHVELHDTAESLRQAAMTCEEHAQEKDFLENLNAYTNEVENLLDILREMKERAENADCDE